MPKKAVLPWGGWMGQQERALLLVAPQLPLRTSFWGCPRSLLLLGLSIHRAAAHKSHLYILSVLLVLGTTNVLVEVGLNQKMNIFLFLFFFHRCFERISWNYNLVLSFARTDSNCFHGGAVCQAVERPLISFLHSYRGLIFTFDLGWACISDLSEWEGLFQLLQLLTLEWFWSCFLWCIPTAILLLMTLFQYFS